MNQNEDQKTVAANNLRSRAESILKEKPSSLHDVSSLSVDQIKTLVHELEVHQIELELQNQELREAQQELSTLMDDYVDLYDMAPVGYLTLSDGGIIVRGNLTAAKLFGIDRKLLLNKPLSSLVVPEDRDKYYLHKIHTSKKTIQNTWELRLMRGDGTVFVAELKVQPILDDNGNVGQFRLVISDISEISETARRIHQSPEILRLFIDQAPVSIAMFDNDMRYLAASNKWATDFRLENSGLVGRLHHKVFPDVPDRFKEHYRRALNGETVRSDEELLERADGSFQWLRWEVKPWYRPNELVGGIIIFSEDITGLKQSHIELSKADQRQHLALQSAKAGMWEWDLLRNEDSWSESFWSLCGIAPDSCKPSREAWLRTVHPDDVETIELSTTKALSGSTEYEVQWRVQKPDGTVRWLWSRGTPVLSDQGQLIANRGIVLDMTDRKLMEEELQRHRVDLESLLHERTAELQDSRNLMQIILDNVPVGIYFVDSSQRYLFSNRNHQMWWKRSADQIVGRKVEEIAGENFNIIKPHLEAALAGQEIVTEHVVNHPDGVSRDLCIKMTPFPEPDGSIKGTIGLLTDVTEAREAQRQLRQSEATFRSLFENSVDGIILGLPDGTLLRANPAACAALGRTEDELRRIGRTGIVDMNDDRVPEHLERVLKEGKSSLELNYERKDGTLFPVEVSSASFTDPDGSQKIMVSFRDITRRKEAEKRLSNSEKRFRELVELLPQGIFEADSDAKMTFMNTAMKRMIGVDPNEDIMGIIPADLADPSEYTKLFEHIEAVKNGLFYEQEFMGRQRDGFRGPEVLVKVSPIMTDNHLGGFRGVVTDISPLKESERERDLLKDRLFQAQKLASLGTLVGGIAHDFNNMLQVIIGYGEILIDDINEGRTDTKPIKTILETAETAANLVKMFMVIGQRSPVIPKPIDLNHRIKELDYVIKLLPNIDSIALDLMNEPANITADSEQLTQIIMNLATNASEAMLKPGRLSLSTSRVTFSENFCRKHAEISPGRYILLTVTDPGRGMDEVTLAQIFDPFFSTKERGKVKGTGLGLSVVRGIVQQQGGFVTCESKPGRGSLFRVYFPEVVSNGTPVIIATSAEYPKLVPTVLVVEDSPMVAGLEQTALNGAGYEILLASNGEEGLNIYRKRHDEIVLVILDILMPEMNGRDCLMELRKINPKVKVIVLTGYDPDGDLWLEMKPHVISFLRKPCRMALLVDTVGLAIKG